MLVFPEARLMRLARVIRGVYCARERPRRCNRQFIILPACINAVCNNNNNSSSSLVLLCRGAAGVV